MSILCVTQKNLALDDFFIRIEKILSTRPYGLILREKQMQESEYTQLANEVYSLCIRYKTDLFLNADISFTLKLAKKLSCGVHTSFDNYQNLLETKDFFDTSINSSIPLGISIHSNEEAAFLTNKQSSLPIAHVITGHIFDTDCKKDLAPRGLDFLKNIVDRIPPDIPVFGIGGMTPARMRAVLATGAKGGAVMSSLMECKDPIKLMDDFNNKNAVGN